MQNVSQTYKDSMASQFRNQSFVRINFGAFDVTAREDATLTIPNIEPQSIINDVIYKFSFLNSYSSWEKDFFKLDGSQYIYPSTGGYYKQGIVSSELSGVDGTFTVHPTLTITFSVNHSMIGLTLKFDTIENDYVTDFTIKGYRDNVEEHSFTVTGNTLANYAGNHPMDDVDKIVIEFTKMNKPNRRLKLTSLLFGLGYEYTNDDIVKCKRVEKVSPTSTELPTYTFDYTVLNLNNEYEVDNKDSLLYFLQPRQLVDIQYGYMIDNETEEIEWINGGIFRLDKWGTSQNRMEANFSFVGILNSYEDKYYKSTIASISLYNLAVNVLTDMGYTNYSIDTSLQSIYTTNPLPIIKHKECLQLIAATGLCVIAIDRSDKIIIKPRSATPLPADTLEMTYNDILGNPIAETLPKLKGVYVNNNRLSLQTTVRELYKETGITISTSKTLHIEFTEPTYNLTAVVTNCTVGTFNKYAYACDITLLGNTTSASLTINGQTYVISSSEIFTYENDDGAIIKINNPLIDTADKASNLGIWIKDYAKKRQQYKINYRGNPELDAQDIIFLDTQYIQGIPNIVNESTIEFDGVLKGELQLRGDIE